jgi:hypothetical protein
VHGEHLPAGLGNEALQFAEAFGSAEQMIANPQFQSAPNRDYSGGTLRRFLLLCHVLCHAICSIQEGSVLPFVKLFCVLVSTPSISYIHCIQ